MSTLKVTVHLWTDETPKRINCWNHGYVRVSVSGNPEHKVRSAKNVMFNSPDEIPAAIAKAVKRSGLNMGDVRVTPLCPARRPTQPKRRNVSNHCRC
jgi:hypothetical protein